MIRCSFHAYEGEPVCPWCAEAAGKAGIVAKYVPPSDACAFCGSLEMRKNIVAIPPYRWCGACGKHAGDQSGEAPRVTSTMI